MTPASPSSYTPPTSPTRDTANPHPYPVKTTSSGLLTRSNSARSRPGLSSHSYAPVCPPSPRSQHTPRAHRATRSVPAGLPPSLPAPPSPYSTESVDGNTSFLSGRPADLARVRHAAFLSSVSTPTASPDWFVTEETEEAFPAKVVHNLSNSTGHTGIPQTDACSRGSSARSRVKRMAASFELVAKKHSANCSDSDSTNDSSDGDGRRVRTTGHQSAASLSHTGGYPSGSVESFEDSSEPATPDGGASQENAEQLAMSEKCTVASDDTEGLALECAPMVRRTGVIDECCLKSQASERSMAVREAYSTRGLSNIGCDYPPPFEMSRAQRHSKPAHMISSSITPYVEQGAVVVLCERLAKIERRLDILESRRTQEEHDRRGQDVKMEETPAPLSPICDTILIPAGLPTYILLVGLGMCAVALRFLSRSMPRGAKM